MKTLLKWFLLGVVILVSIPLVFVAANLVRMEIRMYTLSHADHSHILSACREAIANRTSYRNDKGRDGWDTLHKEDVLLLPPFPSDVPQAIRELNPRQVIIRGEDYAMLDLSLPGHRCRLLGFMPGARQFGTFKYIDGLWFWNGNDSTKKQSQ